MSRDKIYNLSAELEQVQAPVPEPAQERKEEPKDPKADWLVINGKRRPHP